jgi:uncharacterized C2H2 Zn-finger protein
MSKRTKKRASSRASVKCPHCAKLLHGEKGLKMHIREAHEAGKAVMK